MGSVPPLVVRRLIDRLWPPAGPGSFRIWEDGAGEPWVAEDPNDPDSIEQAAAHPFWDDKPRDRQAMLDAARALRLDRRNHGP